METTAKQNFAICTASTNWKISLQADADEWAENGGWPDNAHLMRGHEPIRTLIVDYTNCLMPMEIPMEMPWVRGPLQGHKIFK